MASILGALIARALSSGKADDQDKIRLGILGALEGCVARLEAGAEVRLVWLRDGGDVVCRVMLRVGDQNTRTLFEGQGRDKGLAASVVYVMVGSAVGHTEGTVWAGAAKRLYEGVGARLREEGLL